MDTKFLLLLGPSGVGKSTVIEHLKRLDTRFTYISPFTTRPLRKGETNKVSLAYGEFERRAGEMIFTNHLYGISYGTPYDPIARSLYNQRFPVLDWPYDQLEAMRDTFKDRIYSVYLTPPTMAELKRRLDDGRDPSSARFAAGEREMSAFYRKTPKVNQVLSSTTGAEKQIAEMIYRGYRLQ